MRLLVFSCGAWLFLANASACLFAFGFAAFYVFVHNNFAVAFVVLRIVPQFFDFLYPTVIMSAIATIGHALLAVYWLATWMRRRHAHRLVGVVMPAQLHTTESRTVSQRIVRFWAHPPPEIIRARMLFEIILQTFQANKTSQLVANRQINQLMAIVIITNCWFTPIIEACMRDHAASTVRLVRLVVDSVLDLTYCIAIPLAIFYPYYRDYIGGVNTYPLVYYYKDTWYTNAASEMRQVLITSWLDSVSKYVASLTMLYRMFIVGDAMRLIGRVHRTDTKKTTGTKHTSLKRSRLTRLLYGVMVAWGFAIAGLYVHSAIGRESVPGVDCLLQMRPWGSGRFSCAVLEANCAVQGTTGDRASLQSAIDDANPDFVQVLILSHCAALDIPPIVQSLRNLQTLKVYNSTIVAWNEDAALRNALHPSLSILPLLRVNMTHMPAGLTQTDFPASLWNIQMIYSNLTVFPDAVRKAWKGLLVFGLEGNRELSSIPENLLRLPRLSLLTLYSNSIQSIPDDTFVGSSVRAVLLDDNPLEVLPQSIFELDSIGISLTNVRDLPTPSWSDSKREPHSLWVRAGQTPLCLHDLPATTRQWFLLDCVSIYSNGMSYPIDDEDIWRSRH